MARNFQDASQQRVTLLSGLQGRVPSEVGFEVERKEKCLPQTPQGTSAALAENQSIEDGEEAEEPVQDNKRERDMLRKLGLRQRKTEEKKRSGVDAFMPVFQTGGSIKEIDIELKSVTTDSFTSSTARDVTDAHIAKWRNRHWVFGWYQMIRGKRTLVELRYATPDNMAEWIDVVDRKLQPLRDLEKIVPFLVTKESIPLILSKLTNVDTREALENPKDKKATTRALEEWLKVSYKAPGLGIIVKAPSDAVSRAAAESPALFAQVLSNLFTLIVANGRQMNCPTISQNFIRGLPEISLDAPKESLESHVQAWAKGSHQRVTMPRKTPVAMHSEQINFISELTGETRSSVVSIGQEARPRKASGPKI